MITLTTGHPGDGKTLLTVDWVQRQAEKEGRQVYYSGIADLKLPWIELPDAEKWYECPAGSIIVIDEAQRIFRMRHTGAAVPQHVSQLETHRHHGFDLYIVTQNPMLVDTNVRRLVGRHLHVVRKYGMHSAVVHEWGRVNENVEKSRVDSIRHEWKYPTERFAAYKSAEVHTHKRRIPMRVLIMWAMPFAFLGFGYLAYNGFNKSLTIPGGKQGAGVAQVDALGGPNRASVGKLSTQEYLVARIPRLLDMPESAPVYDQLTAPVAFPSVAGCISGKRGCSCYSGQGTVLKTVSKGFCEAFVKDGAFDPYRAPASASNASAEPERVVVRGGAVPVNSGPADAARAR